jgi:hypothetical protein
MKSDFKSTDSRFKSLQGGGARWWLPAQRARAAVDRLQGMLLTQQQQQQLVQESSANVDTGASSLVCGTPLCACRSRSDGGAAFVFEVARGGTCPRVFAAACAWVQHGFPPPLSKARAADARAAGRAAAAACASAGGSAGTSSRGDASSSSSGSRAPPLPVCVQAALGDARFASAGAVWHVAVRQRLGTAMADRAEEAALRTLRRMDRQAARDLCVGLSKLREEAAAHLALITVTSVLSNAITQVERSTEE